MTVPVWVEAKDAADGPMIQADALVGGKDGRSLEREAVVCGADECDESYSCKQGQRQANPCTEI